MSNADIVTSWNDKLIAQNMGAMANDMSDDFSFSGPTPVPLNKAAYVGMMSSLVNAFPDLKNNLKITGESGGKVEGSVQMAGTHTKPFDLSGMKMPVFPPTGKSFSLPRESFVITVKNGKISGFEVSVPEGGGLGGILAQLGIEMPG